MNLTEARTLLTDELRRLESSRDTLAHDNPDLAGHPEELAKAQDPAEQGEDLVLRANASYELDAIDAQITEVRSALVRLDIGRFGICAVCGAPIETDRLTAIPTATLCAKDQWRHDAPRHLSSPTP
jgi:DnaK suppressor protein